MKITFILKGALEILPPMLPRILYAAKTCTHTSLVCSGISQGNRDLLEEHGVKILVTNHNQKLFGRRCKLVDWSGFRRACVKFLKNEISDSDILYICSADTALALGKIFTKFSYVLQSNELYDQFPLYKKGIKKYVLGACAFVVPEYNRANICSYWYGLKNLPFVIPNIPFVTSRQQNMTIADDYARSIIDSLQGKRIILYQGHISSDRTINSIAAALRKMNDERYALVLMGADRSGAVADIKNIYKQTFHIPFVPPPQHLEITSHAYIAILSYDRVSLNNIFCAPNKIYEYSCYGIPMLGNNIPGLYNVIEKHQIGICASYEQIDSVVNALHTIDEHYDQFHDNSYNFFTQNSLDSLMDELFNYIKNQVQ